MRWLKYIVPEDLKNSLNSNPGFQWLVIVIMFVVGFFLIKTGLTGIKTKRLRGKYGQVYQGTVAQILGIIYVVFGIALPLFAIATKF